MVINNMLLIFTFQNTFNLLYLTISSSHCIIWVLLSKHVKCQVNSCGLYVYRSAAYVRARPGEL